jgi:hypothetical protein
MDSQKDIIPSLVSAQQIGLIDESFEKSFEMSDMCSLKRLNAPSNEFFVVNKRGRCGKSSTVDKIPK